MPRLYCWLKCHFDTPIIIKILITPKSVFVEPSNYEPDGREITKFLE